MFRSGLIFRVGDCKLVRVNKDGGFRYNIYAPAMNITGPKKVMSMCEEHQAEHTPHQRILGDRLQLR
jgi:hypothetical protein